MSDNGLMTSKNNDDKKQAIVRAAISHVAFDGWSMAAIEMAADACDIPRDEIDIILPNGVDEAIALYAKLADGDMVAAYQALDPMPEKTHLKIRALILCRLSLAMAHKQSVAKTLSYLARPAQAKRGTQMLYDTIDCMWRSAGDDTTDISFYSKRATLAAVYSATLLAFLAEDSPDMAKTEAFLDRRLREIAQIPKLTNPAKAAVSAVTEQVGGLVSSFMAGKRRR